MSLKDAWFLFLWCSCKCINVIPMKSATQKPWFQLCCAGITISKTILPTARTSCENVTPKLGNTIYVVVISELGTILRWHYLGTGKRKRPKFGIKTRKKITKLRLEKIISNPLEDGIVKLLMSVSFSQINKAKEFFPFPSQKTNKQQQQSHPIIYSTVWCYMNKLLSDINRNFLHGC